VSAPIAGTTRNVTIGVGPATLIGAITAGSLIVNTSAVAAVWIRGGSAVSPGQGLRIGPLGSLLWSPNDASPSVWVCLDTGAAAVTITVSDQATDPTSPLDVAAALVAQGIPSKLLVTYLGAFTVPAVSTLTVPVDFTPYASVQLQTSDGIGGPMMYGWKESILSFPVFATDYLVANNDPGFGGQVSTLTPVYGPTLLVTNADGIPHTLNVWGFNRQANSVPLTNGTSGIGARWELSTSSWAGLGYNVLPLISGQRFQGAAWINFSLLYSAAPASPVEWYLGTIPNGVNPSGSNLSRIVLGNSQASTAAPFESTNRRLRYGWSGALPAAPFDWWINLSAAAMPAGSTTVSISAIPAQTL
jgi:hypothetical protein